MTSSLTYSSRGPTLRSGTFDSISAPTFRPNSISSWSVRSLKDGTLILGSEPRRRAAPPATGSAAASLRRERLESPICRGSFMHVSFHLCIAQGAARTAQEKTAHGGTRNFADPFLGPIHYIGRAGIVEF